MSVLMGFVAAACVSISGAHITAGDLARAVPAFAPVNPAAFVAWTPLPGTVRVFHSAELERLLTPLDPSAIVPHSDICFERPVAPLSESAVLEAMRTALGTGPKIELVEVSHFPGPVGEIVFPRESLGSSPVALWRGFVRYDESTKFPIWARVKIRVTIARIIAIETLQAGKPIRSAQVKLETVDDTPNGHVTALAIENVEGCIPRRTIPADSPVWTDSIDPPLEIAKGDRVTVRVHSGLAALTFEVEASTSGRRGDFISLKNPDSGKIFRARIDGPKAASVQTDSVKQ
jgi:flagella basal body P-ring formation protein FlgA